MKKKLIIIAILLALVLPFAGGSMIWFIGGADGLDINGVAGLNGRSTSAVEIGKGWSSYGGDAGGNRYSQADRH
jgi:hypothetical protein